MRKTAAGIAAAAGFMLCAGGAPAAEYPVKPVRVIVSTSPSGGTDAVARIYVQRLADAFGVPFVVDNRGGAAGMIGLELAASAAPDGYTLLVMNVGHLMSSLTRDTAFDLNRSYAPISELASTPIILAVHPSVAATTVHDLVALARKRPGQLNYASGGQGGVQHFATVLFEREAKIDLMHVPYKGTGPGLIDLLGGQVQLTLTSMPPIVPHVKSGRLRGLAVTSPKRSEALPDVPTFVETGLPGVDVHIWYGMYAPARTPGAVIDRLAKTAANIARIPEVREKMVAQGATPHGGTPEHLAAQSRSEREKWLGVGRAAGLVAR